MRKLFGSRYTLIVLLLGLLVTACQGPSPTTPAKGLSDSVLAATDPCAQRLDEIRFAFLMYYRTHQRLPEKLDDLRPFAEPGTDLQFTCPASTLPYIYVPAGLTIEGQDRSLILYDAAPPPHGRRWAITAAPAQGDRPVTFWVVQLDEPTLQRYLHSTPVSK